MGDQRFHILDLSATAETARDRARQVRMWLRARGWAEPCEGLVDWRKPVDQNGAVIPADAAGPRVVGPAADQFEREQYPITVIDGWHFYDSGDAFEGFRCAVCGGVSETALDLVDSWDETRRAPVHTCVQCGWTGPLTAWDVRAAVALSHVAISGDLSGGHLMGAEQVLTEEIAAELGGQWAWVYEHI